MSNNRQNVYIGVNGAPCRLCGKAELDHPLDEDDFNRLCPPPNKQLTKLEAEAWVGQLKYWFNKWVDDMTPEDILLASTDGIVVPRRHGFTPDTLRERRLRFTLKREPDVAICPTCIAAVDSKYHIKYCVRQKASE